MCILILLHDDVSVFFYDNIYRIVRFTILYWYYLFLGSLSLDDTIESCLISNGWHSLTLRFTPNLCYNTCPRFVIIYDTETDYDSFSSLIPCSYMNLLCVMILYTVWNHYAQDETILIIVSLMSLVRSCYLNRLHSTVL